MISSYYIYFCAEKLWEIKKLKKEEATTINSKKYQPPHSPTPQIVTNNVSLPYITPPLILSSSSCKLLENFTLIAKFKFILDMQAWNDDWPLSPLNLLTTKKNIPCSS